MIQALPHLCKESSTGKKIYYTWFSAMHTRVDFLFVANEAESFFKELSLKAFRKIAALEITANAFDPASELSFVNAHAGTERVALSTELYEMLSMALDYNRKTFGLFDITTDSKDYDDKSIHCIQLDESKHVSFKRSGIKINLSGFLKGYALDQVRRLIADTSMTGALINMGNSSVMCLGNRDDGFPWKIPCGGDASGEVILRNECLTTSGNDTEERNHIVNPSTGNTIFGKRTTAVVTQSGTLGEVLSTAFFIADVPMREHLKKQFGINYIIDK